MGQKVRRKSVAQGMRCRCIGETEHTAHLLDSPLYEPWIERPASGASEQGSTLGQTIRAGGGIGLNRFAYSWDQRYEPDFAAFAFIRSCAGAGVSAPVNDKASEIRKPAP